MLNDCRKQQHLHNASKSSLAFDVYVCNHLLDICNSSITKAPQNGVNTKVHSAEPDFIILHAGCCKR